MKVLMVMHCIQAHAASISKVCEVLHKPYRVLRVN